MLSLETHNIHKSLLSTGHWKQLQNIYIGVDCIHCLLCNNYDMALFQKGFQKQKQIENFFFYKALFIDHVSEWWTEQDALLIGASW